MMKYKINENENGIDISIEDVKGKKEMLLEAFKECQDGNCSCPTEEYKKLASLDVDDSDENMKIRLKLKHGLTIDKNEINKCLDYTEKHLSLRLNDSD